MATATKLCVNCKERSRNEDMKQAPNKQWFCNSKCMSEYCFSKMNKNKVKASDKAHAQRKRKFNDNDRRIRLPSAQKSFNAFIRERDKLLPCVSCGDFVFKSSIGGTYDCGHYKTVGGFPELRFEELNAHKQCKKCNGGAGNFSKKDTTVSKEYRINLIKKIGLDKVEWIEGPHEPKKYTCADLKEIELKYKQKIKEL